MWGTERCGQPFIDVKGRKEQVLRDGIFFGRPTVNYAVQTRDDRGVGFPRGDTWILQAGS